MKTYMIGYDLNKPGQDYSDLIEKIKSLGFWCHCLESTWIIKTNQTAAQIRDALLPYIDNSDELLVAGLTGEAAWRGLSAEISKWLKDNISPT